MRAISKAILVAPVPVVVYVGPSGARAASAGTYILYASHVAAMVPATNIGAATPIPMGPGMLSDSKRENENSDDGSGTEDDALAQSPGREEMVGASAWVLESFTIVGRVHAHGEAWQAHSAVPLSAGQQICITDLNGLTLKE